jgi:phosphoenolpyruvate-protein kinase (PTS system EI component)
MTEKVRSEVGGKKVKLGAMIEVPSVDAHGALILKCLGIDEPSMPPARVPQIKALLRREDFTQLTKLARKALNQCAAGAVRALRPSN